jgi:hypothetical protein
MKMKTKINTAGWLAIAVAGVIALSGLCLGGRALWAQIRGLDGLQPVSIVERTPETEQVGEGTQPGPVTPRPPTVAGPVPAGWARETDALSGSEYPAPPPEVEAAVRDAFEALLAWEVIEDRSDAEALMYDRAASLDRIRALASPALVAYCESYEQAASLVLAHLGPENPVRCEDDGRCEVKRVQFEGRTAVVHDEAMCQQLLDYYPGASVSEDGTRCIVLSVDNAPRAVYTGVVERQADGVWRIVDWQWEPM